MAGIRTSRSRRGRDASVVDDRPDHELQPDGAVDAPHDDNAISPGLPDLLHGPDVTTAMLRYEEIPVELAEALRTIVNRYELRHGEGLPSTISVTSALGGEGVTFVSQALSTLIAQETGKYVCWVDCSWLALDHTVNPMDGRPGLIDILADRSNILSAFQTSPDLPQLMSLTAGSVPQHKRNVIVRSPEFDRLLDVLTSEFDHVIFDIPPVLANANGLTLIRRSDASLLVVRHRATSVNQFQRALEATQPTPNLGVVLNRYRTSIPRRLRRLLGE
ncbi:MAG: CpsD/CapB family tyrosine-protein kinase [Ilumatobacter sp.]|uniref:CpsD/CapB family tyrosine-protein kinase n=1 Tax=Ilumatobacter sp. TaxID=1967498 RepID=UPI002622812A|nr:CpsD/CapB family tyrosine-protein kinase [Ilumatobacter sp.]MDJ0770835.1 CpsD/CapB family tyrosine-protein kinase [Ilumatobacter sp.]